MRHFKTNRKTAEVVDANGTDRVAEQIRRDVRRCYDDELISMISDHPQGSGGYAEQVFEEAVRELASRLDRQPQLA